jgi:hypothetical protein
MRFGEEFLIPAVPGSRLGNDWGPSLDSLVSCLDERNDWLVNIAAAWALGGLGEERAIPPLKETAKFRVT